MLLTCIIVFCLYIIICNYACPINKGFILPKTDDKEKNKAVLDKQREEQKKTALTSVREEERKNSSALDSEKKASKYSWQAIGYGGYNRAWRSLTDEQLVSGSSYAGPWVLKHPTVSSKDLVSNEMNQKERGVRLWNEINKDLPIAGLYKKGWVAPYIQSSRQATDDEIALKLIEIYLDTRRIILDAATSGNFLTVLDTGKVILVDVDLALRRRNSQASLNFSQTLDVRFASYWDDASLKKSMSQTINVTQNLLFLENNLEPDVIDQLDTENLITLQNIIVLTWLRENNRPLDVDLFYKIASLTDIELEITPDILAAFSNESLPNLTHKKPIFGNNMHTYFHPSPKSEDAPDDPNYQHDKKI